MTSSTQHKRDKRLQPPANRGVARVFKGGGVRFFIEKGKVGSERSERCLRGGFLGEATEDIPFPWI